MKDSSSLKPYFSKCGLLTGSFSITLMLEMVNLRPQTLIQTFKIRICILTWSQGICVHIQVTEARSWFLRSQHSNSKLITR